MDYSYKTFNKIYKSKKLSVICWQQFVTKITCFQIRILGSRTVEMEQEFCEKNKRNCEEIRFEIATNPEL